MYYSETLNIIREVINIQFYFLIFRKWDAIRLKKIGKYEKLIFKGVCKSFAEQWKIKKKKIYRKPNLLINSVCEFVKLECWCTNHLDNLLVRCKQQKTSLLWGGNNLQHQRRTVHTTIIDFMQFSDANFAKKTWLWSHIKYN